MRNSQYQKQLSISIKAEHYNLVKQVSDEKKVSMGEIIRDILEQYFNEVNKHERS